ncbi:MAG: hypothetical protein ACPHGV_06715 [Synechococcus sp.]
MTMRCDFCAEESPLQYRIRHATSQGWRFACPVCWPSQADQPDYQYGGTRKANRRQRQR